MVPVRVAASAVAIALLFGLPATATAATTFGAPLNEQANYFTACDASADPPDACTVFQSSSPAPAGLTAPITGVISRWRVRSISLGTVTLRVLRPNPDGTYTAVGSSLPQSLTQRPARGADASYTFTTRLSVQQGDRIGVDRDRRAGGIYRQAGGDAFQLGVFVPPLADFETGTPSPSFSGVELMLNADVEPDADGDGFGDDSQDNCPAIANDQSDNPCPKTETPTTTGPGSGGGTDLGPQKPIFHRHNRRRSRVWGGARGPAADQFHRHAPRRARGARVARRRISR